MAKEKKKEEHTRIVLPAAVKKQIPIVKHINSTGKLNLKARFAIVVGIAAVADGILSYLNKDA